MGEKQRNVPGTLMRAVDGKLYFIPDSVLKPFEVFESEVSRIEGLLDKKKGEPDPALVQSPGNASSVEAVHTEVTLSTPTESGQVGRAIGAFLMMTE
jgi:hypothetical protein